jgi:hypothetical protein
VELFIIADWLLEELGVLNLTGLVEIANDFEVPDSGRGVVKAEL